MLKQEKTPKKKLIFYIIIITVMFSATGFMIYKNYTTVNNSAGFDNNLEADISVKDDFNDEGAEVKEEDSGRSNIAELNIFNEQKFQGLKRNFLKKVNFIVGKEDPFEIRK